MSFSSTRRRRTVNEINMVPFIDVMLVLLIIFMVTAPMLTPGVIDVPSAGKSSKPPSQHVAYVLLDGQGRVHFKTLDGNEQLHSLETIGGVAASWQAMQPPQGSAVVLQADRKLPYEAVVEAMSQLKSAGVERVALGIKSSAK